MSDDEIRRSQMGLGLTEDVGVPVVKDVQHVVEAAPIKPPETPMEWIKQNLFSGWINGIITVVAGAFAAFTIYQIIRFIFVSGEWAIVQENIRSYAVGSFPLDQLWRVWFCIYFVTLLAGLSFGSSNRPVRLHRRRFLVILAATAGALAFILGTVKSATVLVLILAVPAVLALGGFAGRALGRRVLNRPLRIAWLLAFPIVIVVLRFIGEGVAPRFWTGFLFNILAATVGIFASFPIGIALALGRRGTLPAVRLACVVFIEIFRGVPLVAWLIFSKFVLDLLLPPGWSPPDIIKSFIVMTLFSSAYVAEIVRGGLQGLPAGQYEASKALGLKTGRMMAFVILPQALRSTIPAMISHFISLFKDTSLFVAIEVSDLLAVARRSAASLDFIGRDMEALLFAALVFWIVAFSLSRWSQRLEIRLGIGER